MSKPKRSKAHVVPEPGPGKHWVVYSYAADDPAGEPPGVDLFSTKAIAVGAAVTWAKDYKPSQIFIHGRDGRIQDERTYQDDPFPPPGARKAQGRRK